MNLTPKKVRLDSIPIPSVATPVVAELIVSEPIIIQPIIQPSVAPISSNTEVLVNPTVENVEKKKRKKKKPVEGEISGTSTNDQPATQELTLTPSQITVQEPVQSQTMQRESTVQDQLQPATQPDQQNIEKKKKKKKKRTEEEVASQASSTALFPN